MADNKVFEVSFEKSKFNDSQFMRLKKGKLWICLSSKALGVLADIKDEFNEAVLSKTPVQYKLSQDISLTVDVYKSPVVIAFNKSTIRMNISTEEWTELMPLIPEKPTIVRESKRHCGNSYYKNISMYGCYQKKVDDNVKWFYTKTGAQKYGELQGWDYGVYTTCTAAPERNALLTDFLAFKTIEKIKASVSENCYGCQFDRPSQIEHQCLEPWDIIVDEYYETHAVKLNDVTDDLNRLVDLLAVSYRLHDFSIGEEELKCIVKKNCISDKMLYLFKEV